MAQAWEDSLADRRIGVCSWSLGASTPEQLVDRVCEVGVRSVQLALDPIREDRDGTWNEVRVLHVLRSEGISIISGMMGTLGEDYSSLESIARTGGVRPDATWPANLIAARASARLARRLHIPLVTLHAGFIPHEAGSERRKMVERLRTIADVFDDAGVRLAFETGQESAETLLGALAELDRPSVGVNFDPANMVLYSMGNPVDALGKLAHRVAQVHIKDALPASRPGAWGDEVAAGEGCVDWTRFFETLRERRVGVDLVIEREAGDDRVGDARRGLALIQEHLST